MSYAVGDRFGYNKSIKKSGFKVIGMGGCKGSGTSKFAIHELYFSADTAYYYARCVEAGTLTSLTFYAFYVPV